MCRLDSPEVAWGARVIEIRHVYRAPARAFVAAHHSHHDAHVGEVYALGAYLDRALVAVVIAARPVAVALDDGTVWEVTRLCVGADAPHCTASRLLGRIGRIAALSGVERLISYTRVDEPGTCYLAAGWVPVAFTKGKPHTTGNRSQRWLPGLYTPSTEIVDRVRWERGKGVQRNEALMWDGTLWTNREAA